MRHILPEGHVPSVIVKAEKLPRLVVSLKQIVANNNRVPQPIIERIEALKQIGYAVIRTDNLGQEQAEFYFETTGQGPGWEMTQAEIDRWFADAIMLSGRRRVSATAIWLDEESAPMPHGQFPLSASTVSHANNRNRQLHASTMNYTTAARSRPEPPVVLKPAEPIPIGGRKILIDTSP